ncbi:Na+/H+ antiporter NhaA [Arcanobacterium pinnipediorum]|uniref:Na(+)/H(+) antiporter NhaA n=1 Tax=Arcanobacterium pinnipediorum TaxID=1503041 RepID=A0ABY5AIC8_9ACTO|nr:Na+/H+ antiporter NhaA [Arcanobacterium pinnipediorum]USR79201.1 Na+/H+ antiporter NhaA [Arcanobacterium pinnipediorum]
MPHRQNPIARYRRAMHNEATAGIVLILGAILALIWANSPIRDSYMELSETVIGPHSLHLDLTVSEWAADGLLAIFFFIVGMELKHEFVAGSLRDVKKALVPILAAVFGMVGPVVVYVVVQALTGSTVYDGWAVPVATDIAFALAVLGVFGRGFPPAVRTFLMTLAVVDDLLGIIIIAIFFSNGLNFLYLFIALVVIAVFGFLVQRRIVHWYLMWPLGILAWYFMHVSGVHATIAGVMLGMTIPVLTTRRESQSLTHTLTEKLEFYSAGFILPIFAFFAAGVNVVDSGGFTSMLVDPVSIGIYLGLPLGKFLGIFGGVFFMIKVLRLKLSHGVDLPDIFAISWVAGIGFTVSLLIATLSFTDGNPHGPHARVAVLLGSLLALLIGAFFLHLRANQHQRGIASKGSLQSKSFGRDKTKRRTRSQKRKK